MWLIVAFAGATTIGVLAIGPQVMQLAFGDNFDYDRVDLAIVAVGMGFYLVAASLNQAALAQGQAHRAASRWVVCAVLFVVINLVGSGRPVPSGRDRLRGLLGAAGAAALRGLPAARRRAPTTTSHPARPEELQARLADLRRGRLMARRQRCPTGRIGRLARVGYAAAGTGGPAGGNAGRQRHPLRGAGAGGARAPPDRGRRADRDRARRHEGRGDEARPGALLRRPRDRPARAPRAVPGEARLAPRRRARRSRSSRCGR